MSKSKITPAEGPTLQHPSSVLRNAFMIPLGINLRTFSRAIGVHPGRVSEILTGQRPITPAMALRMGKALGTSAQFWLYLQADYDLREAEKKMSKDIANKIQRIDGVDLIDAGAMPGETWKQGKDRNENRAAPPRDIKLEGNDKVIFELISEEPIHVDELIKKSRLQAGSVCAALTMLELDGLISRRAGERYVRSGN